MPASVSAIGPTLRAQFGAATFTGTYGPVWEHLARRGVIWLVAWWLRRRKLFFRL